MEVEIIRKKKDRPENLISKKLNVAAYIRVSTLREKQTNSLESQKKYFLNLITRNKNWNLVKIYIDNGISGRSVKKREEFANMIYDAMNGKIDLILIKSISRFGRNTVDNLKYMRMLKEKNIGIYFMEEHIYSLNMTGEMLFTVFSTIYQTESDITSNRVSLGMKMNNQYLLRHFFGYKYNKKTQQFSIVKSQAKTIQLIYKLYLDGLATKEIETYLYEKKYKNGSGTNKNWNKNVISKLLSDKRYMGTLIVENEGEEPYEIENHHEAIIDKETFMKVQKLKKERTIMKNRYNYSSEKQIKIKKKIRCGYCGSTVNHMKERIRCSNRMDTYENCVKSASISFDLFVYAFVIGLKKLLEMKQVHLNEKGLKQDLKRLKKLEEKIETEISLLIENNLCQRISKIDFIVERDKLYLEKKNLNQSIKETEEKLKKISYANRISKEIGNIIIENNYDIRSFNQELFDEIVEVLIIGDRKNKYAFRYILKEKNLFEKEAYFPSDFLEIYVENKDEKYFKILDYKKRINLEKFKCQDSKIRKDDRIMRITFEIKNK